MAIDGPCIASESPSPVRAHSWSAGIASSLFSVFFPSDCRICGAPLLNVSRLPVCPDCLSGLEPLHGHICSICGERVLSSFAHEDDDGLCRCPICRRIDRPFKRAVAYGSYDGGLRELIHLLKFGGVRPAAGVLGRMLAEVIATLDSAFESNSILLIPVPLFKAKRRQRGFNQAELIAKSALKCLPGESLAGPGMMKLKFPRARFQLASDVLSRTRDTHSQIGLTSHQRRENLRGAFAVLSSPEVTGREILLVDDVYTTGTTVSECARMLRRAGASKVWVATVARTLKLASKYVEVENKGFNVSGFQSSDDAAESGVSSNLLNSKLENLETSKL